MMKNTCLIFSIVMAVFCTRANAQAALEVKGVPFNGISHTEVEGYPFLENSWVNGTVQLAGGKSIAAKLKLNIYNNTVLFQDKNGQGLELKNNFTGITLGDASNETSNLKPLVFVNGYPAVAKQTDSTLYQLIADGKIKLLKLYKKSIASNIEYTSSEVTSAYKSVKLYYVFKNNRLIETLPVKKAFLKIMNDYAAQVETYLNDNPIDFRSDIDLQKLFNWYNALN